MRGNAGRGDTAPGQGGISQLLIHITRHSWVLFLSFRYFHWGIIVANTIVTSVTKQSISQPMNFLTFTLPIHFQKSGSAWSGCVVLSCWLRLNHDTAVSGSSIFFLPSLNNPAICIGTNLLLWTCWLLPMYAKLTFLIYFLSINYFEVSFHMHTSEYTEKRETKTFLSFWSSAC